jgi:hypothetical protein
MYPLTNSVNLPPVQSKQGAQLYRGDQTTQRPPQKKYTPRYPVVDDIKRGDYSNMGAYTPARGGEYLFLRGFFHRLKRFRL